MRLTGHQSRKDQRLPVAWSRCLAVVAFLVSMALTPLSAQTQEPVQREYAIKAAFLFHFTQFITWPPENLPPPGTPFKIAVFEPNPFGAVLEEIVREETVNGHRIEVVYPSSIEEAANAHILFLPGSARKAQDAAIAALGDKPVLLVSEAADFVQNGGMVALVRRGSRVAILINREALEKGGLSASSRLLRLAQTTEGATVQ